MRDAAVAAPFLYCMRRPRLYGGTLRQITKPEAFVVRGARMSAFSWPCARMRQSLTRWPF